MKGVNLPNSVLYEEMEAIITREGALKSAALRGNRTDCRGAHRGSLPTIGYNALSSGHGYCVLEITGKSKGSGVVGQW